MEEVTPRRASYGQYHQSIKPSGAYYANTSATVTHTWNDSRSGESNPRYKEQIRSHTQAGTPFTGERSTIVSRPYYLSTWVHRKDGLPNPEYIAEWYLNWGRIAHSDPATLDPSGLSEAKADSRALTQLVRKIRSAQTPVQGGVAVGEAVRTLSLLTNPAKALRQGISRYQKTLIKRGPKVRKMSKRETLSMVRDTWLEYQLGWAPLIGEIHDAAKYVAESQVIGRPIYQQVRAVGADKTAVHGTSTAGTPSLNYILQSTSKSEVTVRYIACIDVGTSESAIFRDVGLAPTNWLPTLWELVPYSFVVDYFSNIGEIISAASIARSSVRWVIKTVRRSKSVSYHSWKPNKLPDHPTYLRTTMQNSPGSLLTTRTTVSRNPYYGSLVPTLEFSLPGTGTQWINIAALWDARRELRKFYK